MRHRGQRDRAGVTGGSAEAASRLPCGGASWGGVGFRGTGTKWCRPRGPESIQATAPSCGTCRATPQGWRVQAGESEASLRA